MNRRQTSLPAAWFIVDRPSDGDLLHTMRQLPLGTGLLILSGNSSPMLLRTARTRKLMIRHEHRNAARVHNLQELRSALLRRTPLILLSPIHATRSHPGWRPLPRMRAAALARLAHRRLLALGGMDARRFARIARLGFQGWAGISAFRT